MKLNKLVKLGMAVEVICNETEESIQDIIDALTGICWSEEEASQLKAYHADEEDL